MGEAGVARLLTARGWERAAIIYAFTHEPGRGGQPNKSIAKTSNTLSISQFAALRIAAEAEARMQHKDPKTGENTYGRSTVGVGAHPQANWPEGPGMQTRDVVAGKLGGYSSRKWCRCG